VEDDDFARIAYDTYLILALFFVILFKSGHETQKKKTRRKIVVDESVFVKIKEFIQDIINNA